MYLDAGYKPINDLEKKCNKLARMSSLIHLLKRYSQLRVKFIFRLFVKFKINFSIFNGCFTHKHAERILQRMNEKKDRQRKPIEKKLSK